MQLASGSLQLAAAGRRRNMYIFAVFLKENVNIALEWGQPYLFFFNWGVIPSDIRVAVKLNFRPYIRRYTSPNKNFDTVIP